MGKTRGTWYARERWRRVTLLMARDGTLCTICGEKLDRKIRDFEATAYITFDHITPRSIGGLDNIANLRLAHLACNLARGNDPILPRDEGTPQYMAPEQAS